MMPRRHALNAWRNDAFRTLGLVRPSDHSAAAQSRCMRISRLRWTVLTGRELSSRRWYYLVLAPKIRYLSGTRL